MSNLVKKHKVKDEILEYLSPNNLGKIKENHSFALAREIGVERFVVSTLLDDMQIDGYVNNIETSSMMDGGLGGKLATITPAGLYFHHEGGYTKIKKKENLQQAWVVMKIIAAVLNAILIIGIAAWGVKTQIDANNKAYPSKVTIKK